MASIFLGVNRGQNDNPETVTEGAATGSTDIELRIDTGKGSTRNDVYVKVKQILRYLQDGRSTFFTE